MTTDEDARRAEQQARWVDYLAPVPPARKLTPGDVRRIQRARQNAAIKSEKRARQFVRACVGYHPLLP